VGNDFFDRLCETNATLGVGAEFLELALAAAAGVNLALDDVERAGKLLCGGFGFFDLEDGDAFSDRRTIALEEPWPDIREYSWNNPCLEPLEAPCILI